MARIVEANENGLIPVPSELLGVSSPHARFSVEVHGDFLLLRPERNELPLSEAATQFTPSKRLND